MKHPSKDIEKRIAVAGCKHTTKDLILGLKRYGYTIDHLITISPEKGESQKVAGYYNLLPFANEENIPVTVVETYSLKSENDEKTIRSLHLDMLIVMGWQRLIPEWFLNSLSIGAFGMHGSFKPLPHGRGRSPMNWSILQGRDHFFTHLFKYEPGVDDGPIVDRQMFDLNIHDTCQTSHHKNMISMAKMLERCLPSLIEGSAKFHAQPKDITPSFWPKRTAEDGVIFWEDTTTDIYNLIRSVTRPFPGAFTFLERDENIKLIIWRAIPFDNHLDYSTAAYGEIVEVFYDNTFVVKTGDTTLLILEYEGIIIDGSHLGKILTHGDHKRKVWENLPV